MLAGQANLARAGTDFPRTIGPILEALEEHVTLLRLLGQLGDDPDLVSVRIGTENPVTGLQSTSLVDGVWLRVGAERLGRAGSASSGPTRMDYPTTMASVRAVATAHRLEAPPAHRRVDTARTTSPKDPA